MSDELELNSDEVNTSLQELVESDQPIRWVRGEPPERIADSIRKTRQIKFLNALKDCGVIGVALKAVGINRSTEANWRKGDDPAYEKLFKQAMQDFYDKIETEVASRAIDGVEVPIIGKVQTNLGAEDQIIGHKTVKSDLLLMFLAKRHIPEYRDKYTPQEETKVIENTSPMARIIVNLNLMADRRTATINIGDNQGDNDNARTIDITPKKITDGE